MKKGTIEEDVEKGESLYDMIVERIRKYEPEILRKFKIFILGFYEKNLRNPDGYTPRQVLEMLRANIKNKFGEEVYPFLMDEITKKPYLHFLNKLVEEGEDLPVFFALVIFEDMIILVFDVVLKNGKVWIPSPSGPIIELFSLRLKPDWIKRTHVFARKLDEETLKKFPSYIRKLVYKHERVQFFASTNELIEKILKIIGGKIKEWKKEKIKKQLRSRKTRRTVGFYVDELGRKRKIEK
ncbi:MAG: hypothetical protein ACTSYM_00085 [Candidatus Baldrarchaeia archaeon]